MFTALAPNHAIGDTKRLDVNETSAWIAEESIDRFEDNRYRCGVRSKPAFGSLSISNRDPDNTTHIFAVVDHVGGMLKEAARKADRQCRLEKSRYETCGDLMAYAQTESIVNDGVVQTRKGSWMLDSLDAWAILSFDISDAVRAGDDTVKIEYRIVPHPDHPSYKYVPEIFRSSLFLVDVQNGAKLAGACDVEDERGRLEWLERRDSKD